MSLFDAKYGAMNCVKKQQRQHIIGCEIYGPVCVIFFARQCESDLPNIVRQEQIDQEMFTTKHRHKVWLGEDVVPCIYLNWLQYFVIMSFYSTTIRLLYPMAEYKENHTAIVLFRMKTSWHGTIFCVTGPLWRWIPVTKASNPELLRSWPSVVQIHYSEN